MSIDREKVKKAAIQAGFFIDTDLLIAFLCCYGAIPKKEDPEAWREEYRKKQAAGVKFEFNSSINGWEQGGYYNFGYPKEKYREVKPAIPHLAERKLWLAQREAGTNEVWQVSQGDGSYTDIEVDIEPQWQIGCQYRVKPKTVKRYMAMLRNSADQVYVFTAGSRWEIVEHAKKYNITIIGDIVEREVEIG